ncbi:hypothetical protein DV736_g6674, partial [Chaetothyriales sp. CBS 134916]
MTLTHTGITEEVLNYSAPHPLVQEFEPSKDRAFFADPAKRSLLDSATKVKHLTPYIGTELEGVVFFRGQDITIDQQYELTNYFGKQDRDPYQVDPRHVTILDSDIRDPAGYGADFHSDHSFEANPPAYTLLRLVRTSETGGDTIFTSQTALYDKLSPSFKTLFEGLSGIHSSEHDFINSVNRVTAPFRPPVRRAHPLVRSHPVTKVKSLFYNPSFVIHLEGLKSAEAQHTLNFLREHLYSADDLTVRRKWEPGSVVFWDNRIVAHRAVPGGCDANEREGKRTAIFGEKPFFEEVGSLSLTEWLAKVQGLKPEHAEEFVKIEPPKLDGR